MLFLRIPSVNKAFILSVIRGVFNVRSHKTTKLCLTTDCILKCLLIYKLWCWCRLHGFEDEVWVNVKCPTSLFNLLRKDIKQIWLIFQSCLWTFLPFSYHGSAVVFEHACLNNTNGICVFGSCDWLCSRRTLATLHRLLSRHIKLYQAKERTVAWIFCTHSV